MLRGMASTRSTVFGASKCAMRARAQAMMSAASGGPGFQDDDRFHRLAPCVVGHADHGRVGY
jgi:hypothetical protein